MLKYTDTEVTFAEVPDEITLCINISNCPCHCEGCHSSYLAEDVGAPLNEDVLSKLIEDNRGISCVSFMGGDAEPWEIHHFAMFIKEEFPGIKVAWYSGRKEIHSCINLNLFDFDYIKVGPYIKDKGPLNSKTTNQRLYRVFHSTMGTSKLYDITHKFWKSDN